MKDIHDKIISLEIINDATELSVVNYWFLFSRESILVQDLAVNFVGGIDTIFVFGIVGKFDLINPFRQTISLLLKAQIRADLRVFK